MSQLTDKKRTTKKDEPVLDIFSALNMLSEENHIGLDVLCEKLEAAMLKAAQKAYPRAEDDDFRIIIDPEKREFRAFMKKSVVEGKPGTVYEVCFEEAKLFDPDCELGDLIECELEPKEFGRTIAQFVKQSVRGELRTINREQLLAIFGDKEHQLITAEITDIDPAGGTITLTYQGTELYLSKREQMFYDKDVVRGDQPATIRVYENRSLKVGQLLKVYVTNIANKQKKPIVRISRVRPEFVQKLIEDAVPEIQAGIVEIKAVSREPGFRSKIAVISNDPENVDAIGACLGVRRTRQETVLKELFGDEKIDLVRYSDNPEEFIASALAPAEVISVTIEKPPVTETPEPEEEPVTDAEGENAEQSAKPENRPELKATVIVPDNQQSLAIGNKGQNAKLAAKLTGYRIDIHPQGEVPAAGDAFTEDAQDTTAENAPETAEQPAADTE